MKKRIKTGDEVVILSGDSKGERGKVLQVLTGRQRVLVEGINKIKRHERQNPEQPSPDGGIIEREAPIHISNVMDAKRYETRSRARANGKKGDS